MGVFNGSPSSQTYVYTATYFTDQNSVLPIGRGSGGNEPLRDDAGKSRRHALRAARIDASGKAGHGPP